jgi:glycosyltransferase involved in cell wall biosynthesis
MLAITALLGSKKPIIVADRSDPSKTPEKSILRVFRNFLYRFSSKVVVQTTQNYRYFSSRVRNKTIVIPNPVDMKGMVGAALKTEKRKRIVSVGRLIPPKNQTLLIEAFNIISKEYPEYSLTIYGEGESRRELESFTHEFGISDRVEFPGSKQNIHELLSDASLFVLPSLYEGMPNALIEAMSLGLPCISTLVSGADDLIQNNYNGLIVKNNDLEDMISGIRMMLTSDMLRNTCAKNATKIVEKLEPERITSEWESVIRVLLQ